MTENTEERGQFVGGTETFHDIFECGAKGGILAINSYLGTRRQLLVRDMSRVTAKGQDAVEYLAAISVFDRAISLLAELSPMPSRETVFHAMADKQEDTVQH